MTTPDALHALRPLLVEVLGAIDALDDQLAYACTGRTGQQQRWWALPTEHDPGVIVADDALFITGPPLRYLGWTGDSGDRTDWAPLPPARARRLAVALLHAADDVDQAVRP